MSDHHGLVDVDEEDDGSPRVSVAVCSHGSLLVDFSRPDFQFRMVFLSLPEFSDWMDDLAAKATEAWESHPEVTQ